MDLLSKVFLATLVFSIAQVRGIPVSQCKHGVDFDNEGNPRMCSADRPCKPGYTCTKIDKARRIGQCCRIHQDIFCDYGNPEKDSDELVTCGRKSMSRCSSDYECVLIYVYGSELGLCCPKRPQIGQKPLHSFVPKVIGTCPASYGCRNGRVHATCHSDSDCSGGKKCCQIVCAKMCVPAHMRQTRDLSHLLE